MQDGSVMPSCVTSAMSVGNVNQGQEMLEKSAISQDNNNCTSEGNITKIQSKNLH